MKKWKRFAAILIGAWSLAFCLPSLLPGQMEAVSAAPRLSAKSKTLKPGQSFRLRVRGSSRKPKFSSTNRSVATVTSAGKVKAKKSGKAYIKVKTGRKTLRCRITVRKKYSLSAMNQKVNRYLKKRFKNYVSFRHEAYSKGGKYYFVIRYQGGSSANTLSGFLRADPYTGKGTFSSLFGGTQTWKLL